MKLERLRVLVVEDNQAMRDLVVAALTNLGIGRIYQIANPERIFESMREGEPDVIITDWQMDHMDGIEMVKKIRRDKLSPDPLIPIIIVTGYNSKPRVEEARDAGVTEFLIKPFTAEDIAKRLASIINKPRDFVQTTDFLGPDRRRRKIDGYSGSKRRDDDT